jgi:hypothetical protein
LDLNEPGPETKKVTDFLAGITDPRLSNAKDLILGDAQRLQDFESCQQYLKMLIYNKMTQEKHERQVLGTQQGKQNSYKGRWVDTDRSKSPQSKDVTARTYTQGEWGKLTDEERTLVKQLRRERKSKRRGTNRQSNQNARNTSAATQDGDNEPSAGESSEEEPVNPASDSSSEDKAYNAPTRRSGRSVVGKRN